MDLKVLERLSAVDAACWNHLVGDGLAFLEWEWLSSLEESKCVASQSGWLPQHLTLWDDGRLIGACPLYLKSNSMGEFVFDHGWAEAAERGGIAYYPKLLVAVPFTPAVGPRFLVDPSVERAAVVRVLGEALKELCTSNELSSVHVNFCQPDEAAELARLGYVRRTGFQYQWENPGWGSFEDYLAALRSKRRNQVRRERRELEKQGIEVETYAGEAIPDDLFQVMFELYRSTVNQFYWGRQYLNERMFDLLRGRWKHRLVFVVARRGGKVVAGTINVRKGEVLYGRYWGVLEEHRFLHFNVCYYAAIDYCLREGIRRFEPGAGGEFKHLRGFDARLTESMHFLADPRLARAVADYLVSERAAVGRQVAVLEGHTALKR